MTLKKETLDLQEIELHLRQVEQLFKKNNCPYIFVSVCSANVQ